MRDRPVSGDTGDDSTQFDSQHLQRQRTTGRTSTLGKDSVATSAVVQVSRGGEMVTSLFVEMLPIRRRHEARRRIAIRRIDNSNSYHDGELTGLLANSIADNQSVFKTS